MSAGPVKLKAGDTLTINGRAYTVRETWSSFGVAWQCACPLNGEGDPCLFYSDVESPHLARGYTLRVPNPYGRDTFVAATVSQ